MMPLVTLQELSLGFRGPPLLDQIDCRIERGDRVGLLGRNGAGKSSLLRLIGSQLEPDGGRVVLAPGTRVSLLPQEVPRDIGGSVHEVVSAGLERGESEDGEPWKRQRQVREVLSRMALDGDARFESLSAGMKRRVLLGRALVSEPDLLLLDEPTNHLDIAAIEWLEELLTRWAGTLIFVTHDRIFLRKLTRRILELDRGHLFDWACDYETFERRKEASLEAEEKQQALFDKKLAQEEAWIRQGIKARRTRNQGRVRALQRLRVERLERRVAPGKVKMGLYQDQRSGRLVARAENVTFAYGERTILEGFSTTILRGDKVGIIGPNGAGKTTLLRVLLGELSPASGTVQLGTHLQIAYFDQLRAQLDDAQTVEANVGDGYSTVRVAGEPRHILGYLQDFLFSPERARTPVRFLSGGERNRVMLAKLFAKPANVIVLDEPTNDLDTETLELLESLLVEYQGTVLLVSHDRAFLNDVVTSTIACESPPCWREYVGGYDDWLRQRANPQADPRLDARPSPAVEKSTQERTAGAAATRPRERRLSFREQQELASLPGNIERIEAEIAGLHDAMASPEYYRQPGEEIARQAAQLKAREEQLAEAYRRWEELERITG